MADAEINNPAWHYAAIGDPAKKPTFVWLHGWGQDHTSFTRLSALFKGHGHHLLFDQPGFGKSTALPAMDGEAPGTADYADALAGILVPFEDCIFIGHSFGVRVSMQMAARHPNKVAAIVGIAGAGLQRKRSLAFKVRAFALRTLGKLARVSDKLFNTQCRDAFAVRFGSADYKNAGEMRGTFVKVVNENLTTEAMAAQCPVCLIYGADDTETPPELGQKYKSLIKHSELHELAGFNHWDILDRGAYQCEAIIKPFLKQRLGL